MITDNDVKKLKEAFATKDDLKKLLTKEDGKKFLTKEDGKKFLTKEDGKKFLTKEDGKKFATKDDLEELELRVAKSFAETQHQIFNIQNTMVTRDEFITLEDHMLGQIKTLFDENLVRSEHRREIDDHEKRITKLEIVTFAN